MDDSEFHGLVHAGGGPGKQPRPIDAVLDRSYRIRRRRRRSVRIVGVTATVAGFVGVVAVASRVDHNADLATGPSSALPELQELCPPTPGGADVEQIKQLESSQVPAEEVDGLRFLPRDPPEGRSITRTTAWRSPSFCVPGLSLVLQRDAGYGTIDATIYLTGPWSGPLTDWPYGDQETTRSTELRGVEARLITLHRDVGPSVLTFVWTDASGAGWALEGHAVDESTLRATAEALVLDASAAPPADLATEDIPAGFEVVWQSSKARSPSELAGTDTLSWMVELGGGEPADCAMWVTLSAPTDPPLDASAGPGTEIHTVRGQAALLYPGHTLEWQEPTGARIRISCDADTDALLRMADSLAEVQADDPRLRPG